MNDNQEDPSRRLVRNLASTPQPPSHLASPSSTPSEAHSRRVGSGAVGRPQTRTLEEINATANQSLRPSLLTSTTRGSHHRSNPYSAGAQDLHDHSRPQLRPQPAMRGSRNTELSNNSLGTEQQFGGELGAGDHRSSSLASVREETANNQPAADDDDEWSTEDELGLPSVARILGQNREGSTRAPTASLNPRRPSTTLAGSAPAASRPSTTVAGSAPATSRHATRERLRSQLPSAGRLGAVRETDSQRPDQAGVGTPRLQRTARPPKSSYWTSKKGIR